MPVQSYAETDRLDPPQFRLSARGSRVSRLALAIGAGLAVAGGVDWVLTCGPAYRAHAIAGVPARLQAESGLDEAVILATARPVFLRAAGILRDQGFITASAGQALDPDAEALAAGTAAIPDPAAGGVVLETSGASAESAAAAANAVAKAFIDIENGAASAYQRRELTGAADTAEHLAGLAAAAHRRLDAALTNIDPAQRRAKAAAVTIRARTHFEAFEAMLASGSPPIGAQTGLPPSIAPLQADYLELKRQLVLAKRAMGAKYSGAATLENAMHLSAKKLQAEWERLTQAAKANWELARDAEAAVAATSASGSLAAQQEALDARLAAKTADDALAQSQAATHLDPPYHLIAPAAIPASASGLPMFLRHVLAALSGLAAAFGVLSFRALDPRRASAARGADLRGHEGGLELDAPSSWAPPQSILARLSQVEGRPGAPLIVFIGSMDDSAVTAPASLDLAREAGRIGHRVLLVEAHRARSRLASAVTGDATPVVVDILGTLKATLPDRMVEGVYIAPAVPGAAHLAVDLARDGDVEVIREAGDAFDLAIVDGGRAGSGFWADWGEAADAVIRVGHSGNARDDDAFLAAAGVDPRRFLGVIHLGHHSHAKARRPAVIPYHGRYEPV